MAHDVWQDTAIQIVRVLINDTDYDNYTYSDSKLLTAFVVNGYTVTTEVEFTEDYTIDIPSNSITPDPSDDSDFITLVSYKTACMIYTNEYKDAANCAVTVKDGVSSISYGPVADNLSKLADHMCSKYEQLKSDFEYGSQVGQAILSPYSPGSDLISRNNTDHRSGGYFNY